MKPLPRVKREGQALADAIIGKDIKPAYWSNNEDEEVQTAARSPFTAWELAQRRNHHYPALWKAVKGTPYDRVYRYTFPQVDKEDAPAGPPASRGFV